MRDYTPRTYHFKAYPLASGQRSGTITTGNIVAVGDYSWLISPAVATNARKDIQGKYFAAKRRKGITVTNLDPVLPVFVYTNPPVDPVMLIAAIPAGVGQYAQCVLKDVAQAFKVTNTLSTTPMSLPNCIVMEEYEEKSFRISRPIVQEGQYGEGQVINTQLGGFGEGANDATIVGNFLDRGYITNTDRYIRGNDGIRYIIRQRLGYTLYNFDTANPLKVISTVGSKVLYWLPPATNANTPSVYEMDELESCDTASGGNGFALSKGASGPLHCVLTGHYEAATLLEVGTSSPAPAAPGTESNV